MDRYALLSLVVVVLFWSTTVQKASRYDQTAHLVEVNGREMFLDCTGSANGPTVILEAGTGDSSDVWTPVQRQVEQFAHVCSYDRLGARGEILLGGGNTPVAQLLLADLTVHCWRTWDQIV